jgi:hypothetical protein
MGQNGLRVGFNGHSHIFTSPLQRQKPQMVLFFDYLLFFLIQFLIKKAEGFPSAFAMRTDEPRVSAFHAALGCLKRVDLLFGFTCNFGDSMPVLLKQAIRIKAQCIQSGSHIFTVSGVAVRIGKGPIHIRRRGQVQTFFVNGEASASFFFLHRLNDHVRSRSEAIVHNFLSGCIANRPIADLYY